MYEALYVQEDAADGVPITVRCTVRGCGWVMRFPAQPAVFAAWAQTIASHAARMHDVPWPIAWDETLRMLEGISRFMGWCEHAACVECGGTGEVKTYWSRDRWAYQVCPVCCGTGHVSEVAP